MSLLRLRQDMLGKIKVKAVLRFAQGYLLGGVVLHWPEHFTPDDIAACVSKHWLRQMRYLGWPAWQLTETGRAQL